MVDKSYFFFGTSEGTRLHLLLRGADRGSPTSSRRRRSFSVFYDPNGAMSTATLAAAIAPWTLPRAKNCSPALNFYTSLRTGAALSSPPSASKNGKYHLVLPVFWYTGRDSNPQPSEPESDALSIEPPVHLLKACVLYQQFTIL